MTPKFELDTDQYQPTSLVTMTTSMLLVDEPPPYDPANHDDTSSDLIQPVMLQLNDQFIYPSSTTAFPLYELSRDVSQTAITDIESNLSFRRLVHHVRTNTNGTPRVVQRDRLIFDLKYLPPAMSNFPYCLAAKSRGCVGNLALKEMHIPHSGFRVVRTRAVKDNGFPKGYRGRKNAVVEVGVVLLVKRLGQRYQWLDVGRNAIAVESESEGQRKLDITVPVARQTMDELVASWCLRLWRDSMENKNEIQGWKSFKRTAQSRPQVLPRYW
ncbi:uncharacterized protein BCR38DRAFT_524924 [Pseudomassariella vexata]|uniref:Uncharacterized protein n=1 Tax=Pseudomassariella vexata TaxID=1141098 RepID=A0A1Y2DW34_9PEZI|nr:uncharacterized protein BCR38DRAFT_524924 [Pseudomassariella vexata]ORY63346.1 hypothetical protein BCR38DRAFT_524924 [Pseudomassariella vexata]